MVRRGGFSLIEAIVAIVVVATTAPAMLLAMRTSHASRVTPMMASQARWLAIEKLEDVIADRASPVRGYGFVEAGNYPAELQVPSSPAFARSVSITETGSDLVTLGEGYKTVVVTVSWTGPTGPTRAVRLSTVLTELE